MANPFKAPSWYKNIKSTKSPLDSMTNALLPYLSNADMRSAATKLAATDSSAYGTYQDASIGAEPGTVTPTMRSQYLSASRADGILKALNRMKATGGYSVEQLGPGYNYLVGVVSALKRLGGTGQGGMTRAQYQEFNNTVDNLTTNFTADSRTGQSASQYSTLAKYIASPGFASGNLVNQRKSGNRVLSGTANNKLFG